MGRDGLARRGEGARGGWVIISGRPLLSDLFVAMPKVHEPLVVIVVVLVSRGIDREHQIVGAQPVPLSVSVGEDPGLEQLVLSVGDARYDDRRAEGNLETTERNRNRYQIASNRHSNGRPRDRHSFVLYQCNKDFESPSSMLKTTGRADLLVLIEKVVGVAIEHHPPHGLQGEYVFRPSLCDIKRVEIELVLVRGVHALHHETPLGIVSVGHRVVEVLGRMAAA